MTDPKPAESLPIDPEIARRLAEPEPSVYVSVNHTQKDPLYGVNDDDLSGGDVDIPALDPDATRKADR